MGRVSLLMLWFGLTAFTQNLEVTPASVDRGSANIIRVVFKPSAEHPVTALQWEMVPRGGLRIEPSGVVLGTAAEAAGKKVTCARRPAEGNDRRLRCIMAGGTEPISAGVIAIMKFEAGNTAAGKFDITFEKIVGVSPSAQPVPIQDMKASITVR